MITAKLFIYLHTRNLLVANPVTKQQVTSGDLLLRKTNVDQNGKGSREQRGSGRGKLPNANGMDVLFSPRETIFTVVLFTNLNK